VLAEEVCAEGEHFADVESACEADSPHTGSRVRRRRRRTSSKASVGSSVGRREATRPESTSPPFNGESSSTEEGADLIESEREDAHSSSASVKGVRRRRRRAPEGKDLEVREKLLAIDRALALGDWVDAAEDDGQAADGLSRLRQLASSEGGLMDDDVRRRVWPALAGVEASYSGPPIPSQNACEAHPEYQQVVLDVARSLKRFPPGIEESARPELQDQLTRLIVRVLLRRPGLHYYQGYHDVAITFLLVVGEEMGYQIVEKLSASHLKEFMAPNMERTTFWLNYMYPIVSSFAANTYRAGC